MKPHEKLKRRPLGGESLGYEAFAALAPAVKAPQAVSIAPAPPASPPTSSTFRVKKSRKGNWPLALEKRGGGKVITVLSKVEGDKSALLAALRKHCGAGGAVREGAVEIQGDQREKVVQFLEGQPNP